ncbi:MAG: hypothetical protein H6576_06530 [Lewinellaceae bacterium]|nr:hypothetical protein [Saprospiraceae bacterium]MCB9343333.1 hypothetical protein [Lewinellaceae bacterium]
MKTNINILPENKSSLNASIQELRDKDLLKLLPEGTEIEKLSLGETIDGLYKLLFYTFPNERFAHFGSFIILEGNGIEHYAPALGFESPEEKLQYNPEEKTFSVLYTLIETQEDRVVDQSDFDIEWKLAEKTVLIKSNTVKPGTIEMPFEEISQEKIQSLSNVHKLKQLDFLIASKRIFKTYEGDPYKSNLHWKFYRCYLDEAFIRQQFKFSDTILTSDYDGRVAGAEFGFYDKLSGFGIMGIHEHYVTPETVRIDSF